MLALSFEPHTYEKAGKHCVLAKVIHIFDDDTSQGFVLAGLAAVHRWQLGAPVFWLHPGGPASSDDWRQRALVLVPRTC